MVTPSLPEPCPLILGVISAHNCENLLGNKIPTSTLKACNGFEFRADTFPMDKSHGILLDVRNYLKKLADSFQEHKLLLYTLRLERDGGNWADSPEERNPLFTTVIQEELADWVDLEIETAQNLHHKEINLIKQSKAKFLVSHHNFQSSYSIAKFEHYQQSMSFLRPDITKFAVTARTQSELQTLLTFSSTLSKEYPLSCVMSMGQCGPVSRLVSPITGAPIVYGYLGEKSVVPGQIEVRELYKKVTKLLQQSTNARDGRLVKDLEQLIKSAELLLTL